MQNANVIQSFPDKLNFPAAYQDRRGVEITRVPSKLLVMGSKKGIQQLESLASSPQTIKPVLESINLNLEETEFGDDLGMETLVAGEKVQSFLKPRLNQNDNQFFVRHRDERQTIDQGLLQDLVETVQSSLDWNTPITSPVFRFPGTKGQNGLVSPLPHALFIKKTQGMKDEDLDQRLDQWGLNPVLEISKYLSSYRYYVLQDNSEGPVFQILTQIAEDEKAWVEDVQLDFVPICVPTALVPSDPHYPPGGPPDPFHPGQWNMRRIQAGGDGTTGWDLATGKNVVVAIIDEGCDLDHPDFEKAFHPKGATFNLDYSTTPPRVTIKIPGGRARGSDHGTQCAGIIGARHNDLGGAGLAGECQVLPLYVAYYELVLVAAAINYAVQEGAQVISMSFGGDVTKGDYLNHPVIEDEINNAFAKGCVLCAATMNTNEDKIYRPASHPHVIACGASNDKDQRCGPSDWGKPWAGSNYGPELSVVAPGVDIPTTKNGGYDFRFRGTSAATPHVAALAALLLSACPTLTNVQVRQIIEETADQVPDPALYKPASGKHRPWFNQMGYGRINVLAALQEARRLCGNPTT